ncbi:hypothetical protein ACF0H5_022202 [Mactra antiquata]
MYVYLRWRDAIKQPPKVSLNLKRCMPVVRTYSEERIDPALWFKVLVLNSVLVDIDRRKVFWTCENPKDSSKFLDNNGEQFNLQNFLDFFNTQEEISSISEYDNFEYDTRAAELFETARRIYTHLSMEVFDRVGNVSTYEDLLKILHVFILPEVKFHLKDRPSIQAVYDAMENECQMVESSINRKINEKRHYEESLARQRKSLVKTGLLLGHLNIHSDEKFYTLLSSHLDKDVKRLEDNVVSLTDNIVHLKKYGADHCDYKLSQARETRSKYIKDKEKLLYVKEELNVQRIKKIKDSRKSRPFLGRSKSLPKKSKGDSTYSTYVNESKLLDAASDEIRSLINNKIKLSGMREAVHLTITEIDGDGVSYGFNRKHGAFEAEADMFDPKKKPDDWMTLREQVQDFLNSDRSETKTRHDQFCGLVKTKCLRLLTGNRGKCSKDDSSSSTEGHVSKLSKRYSVRWLHGSVPKKECEKLCEEVSEYILDTAHMMALEIQGRDSEFITYHTHVYICYEKHVADDVMPELSKVFKESFRNQCEQLYEWIATYSMTELEFITKLMSQLFPDENDRDIRLVNPTGSLPRDTSGQIADTWENGGNCGRGLSRLSKSLEHLPLSTLVDTLHEQTGNLAITFEKAWSVVSCEGDSTKSLKSLCKDDKIYTTFSEFFKLVQKEMKTFSIFDKLRLLSRAVQIVQSRAEKLLKLKGHKYDLTTDDMLDILILLICKLDPNSLLCLYADLNLILHLTPSFLQGSMSQYCLVTLTGAFQHLFERQELQGTSSETNA